MLSNKQINDLLAERKGVAIDDEVLNKVAVSSAFTGWDMPGSFAIPEIGELPLNQWFSQVERTIKDRATGEAKTINIVTIPVVDLTTGQLNEVELHRLTANFCRRDITPTEFEAQVGDLTDLTRAEIAHKVAGLKFEAKRGDCHKCGRLTFLKLHALTSEE